MLKTSIVIIIIVIAGVGYWIYQSAMTPEQVKNFDECIAKGYLILESYPRQCKTPDNEIFTEIIPSIEPEPIGPDTEVFTEPPELEESFCGESTRGECLIDSDCFQGGCSGELCQSKKEEAITTPCVFRECFNKETYGMQCKCVNEQCQWYEYPAQ